MARGKNTIPALLADKKTCQHCVRHGRDPVRPATEYRYDPESQDGLYFLCRACEKQLYDDFRLAQRHHARSKTLTEILQQMRRGNAATLPNLVDGWVGQFGGLEGFLRESMAHYEHLAATRPGSPQVISYLNTVAKMVAAAQKYRPPERPESELTEEELTLEVKVLSRKLGLEGLELSANTQDAEFEVNDPSAPSPGPIADAGTDGPAVGSPEPRDD